jgi:hypothetical protein
MHRQAKTNPSPSLNSSKMNLSTASAAFNDAANDGTIPNVDAVLHSLPRLRQSQRPKRQLAQLDPDDDENDGKTMASLTSSFIVRIKPVLHLAVESIHPCVSAER